MDSNYPLSSPFGIQFREGVAYRRLGLLDCNRFGEYFFNNQKKLANAAIKAEAVPTMESKAAGTGRTLVEVQRQLRYPFVDAKTAYRPYVPPNQNQNNQQSRKSDFKFRFTFSEEETLYVTQDVVPLRRPWWLQPVGKRPRPELQQTTAEGLQQQQQPVQLQVQQEQEVPARRPVAKQRVRAVSADAAAAAPQQQQ
jgi:hypothetical protein